jgi:hypothetical protein
MCLKNILLHSMVEKEFVVRSSWLGFMKFTSCSELCTDVAVVFRCASDRFHLHAHLSGHAFAALKANSKQAPQHVPILLRAL